MKLNIRHNKTVNTKKTNTMDGFTKYVPPHMRKRNRKNKNKKNKNVDTSVNLNDASQFPELVSQTEHVIDNMDWVNKTKEIYTYQSDREEEDEYFNIGNITFKQCNKVKDGWIVLNKNSSLNRGNYHTLEFTTNEEIEWYYKCVNYFDLVENMERNPSNGVMLLPKNCIDSLYEDYCEEYDYSYEEDNYYNEESDNEEVVEQDNIIYDDSDYSDY